MLKVFKQGNSQDVCKKNYLKERHFDHNKLIHDLAFDKTFPEIMHKKLSLVLHLINKKNSTYFLH